MSGERRYVRGFDGSLIEASTWSDPEPAPSGPAPRYRCPDADCKWEGTQAEMLADAAVCNDDGDEAWSNWICPRCEAWWQLEDYTRLDQ